MKSAEYLNEVKSKLNMHTDKELADHYGVTKAAISQYKSGARIMENEMCLAVALDLDADPMKIIMAADVERASRAGQHSLWEVFSQRMAATAASALLVAGVTLFLTPESANAGNTHDFNCQNASNINYAKFQINRSALDARCRTVDRASATIAFCLSATQPPRLHLRPYSEKRCQSRPV